MINAEIRVNGILIENILLYNTGVLDGELMFYEVHSYSIPEDTNEDPIIKKTTIRHRRDEGATVLMHKAIKALLEMED